MTDQTFKITFTMNGKQEERIVGDWVRLGTLLSKLSDMFLDPDESVKGIKVEVFEVAKWQT